ncbi:hypothetical protein [Paenibacillus xerothermodurans]|uniref:hypothetical protein n=1 Tax=Paenibacillus xerothermodurans TaxID=1977292 RepID=UPI0014026D0D|nr:hypothetical protein [Paenibacillus xerothermodurans]
MARIYYRRSEEGAEILGYVDKTKNRVLEFWTVDVRYIPFVSIWLYGGMACLADG